MKTVEVKVYSFDELNEGAKQKAIENYRNKGYYVQDYYDEIIESVEAVTELFNLKTGRKWDDINSSGIDDCILGLKGVRLYKYIVNNYYNNLFAPKYIGLKHRKMEGKQFIFKVSKDYKGNDYTQIFSKIFKTNDGCPLTGMCYDYDILQPVYDFLKKPDKNTTFEDLIKDIENAITKTFKDAEEWLNSDEFIKDEIEANKYEFTEDGARF